MSYIKKEQKNGKSISNKTITNTYSHLHRCTYSYIDLHKSIYSYVNLHILPRRPVKFENVFMFDTQRHTFTDTN